MAKKSFSFPKIEIGSKFSTGISTHVDWEPQTNIIDTTPMLIIEVELPGVNKKDVSIILETEHLLIIRGVKHHPRKNENEGMNYYLFEREFGSFYKRIVLDFPLESEGISSTMENGVLTVKIPKKKTGKIPVEIK